MVVSKEYVSLDFFFFFCYCKAINNEVRISQTKCASCFGVVFLCEQRANLILGQFMARSARGRTVRVFPQHLGQQ